MRVRISKAELLSLMQPLPPDASAAEVIDEAMYQLVLSYSIDKACQNVTDGMGISRAGSESADAHPGGVTPAVRVKLQFINVLVSFNSRAQLFTAEQQTWTFGKQ